MPEPINFKELDETNSYPIKLVCFNCKEENLLSNTKMPFGVPVMRFKEPVRFQADTNRPIGGNISGYFLRSLNGNDDNIFFSLDCELCQCPQLQ